MDTNTWIGIGWFGLIAAAAVVGIGFLYILLLKIIRRFVQRTHSAVDNAFFQHCTRPIGLLLLVLVLMPVSRIAQEILVTPPGFYTSFRHVLVILTIVGVAWLVIRLTRVLQDFIVHQYDVGVQDNLRARKIHTQLRVLNRVVIAIVGVFAFALILMTFERVRTLGTSILASAGVIGIIVGFAAQRSIATLIAGMQIAITQPIRLDDVVIVENEWGRIEEITLTYVVVRIWDLRRLVLPITYFIETPFQNWTRTSADILGTAYFYVDYTFPVESMRNELQRILKDIEDWDGKVAGLQVTGTNERTMELRALMSASDASKAWNLRCVVREKLVHFLQQNYPDCLPKYRAEIPMATEQSHPGS